MSELDLTSADRCDLCGSQAWVRGWINTNKSDLLWCGHHWRDQKEAFAGQGGIWLDQTDRINAQPDASPA